MAYNETIFTLLFISLFTIEQAFLIWYISLDTPLETLKTVIGFFALVVITTATLQKVLLDTKRRYDKENKGTLEELVKSNEESKECIKRFKKIIETFRELNRKIVDENKKLREKLKKK